MPHLLRWDEIGPVIESKAERLRKVSAITAGHLFELEQHLQLSALAASLRVLDPRSLVGALRRVTPEQLMEEVDDDLDHDIATVGLRRVMAADYAPNRSQRWNQRTPRGVMPLGGAGGVA